MSVLAWPICVCGAVLIALLIFKKEISRLIDRIRKISKQGVDADSLLPPQDVATVVKPSSADELLRNFDNQLLLEQENLITRFLDERNVRDPSEREKILVRYLASAYIISRFENIYHSIWGSQCRALEMLNESEPQGLPHQALEAWYEVGKAGYSNWYVNYSFEHWLEYMKRAVLITVDTDALVHITVFGNEFLKYLVQSNYSTTNKSG